jgi:hypothetical protein
MGLGCETQTKAKCHRTRTRQGSGNHQSPSSDDPKGSSEGTGLEGDSATETGVVEEVKGASCGRHHKGD